MESVIVSDPGCFLGKTSERLVVRGPRPRLELLEGGPQLSFAFDLPVPPPLTIVTSNGPRTPEPPLRRLKTADGKPAPKRTPDQLEFPLFRISEIVIASSGVTLSSDLIEACCERGIRVSFLTRTGRPFAMLSSPMLTATVATRREQMAAYGDGRSCQVACALVRGKLANQAALLKYFGKYLKTAAPEAFESVTRTARAIAARRGDIARATGDRVDDIRGSLLAIEGAAGRDYWGGVRAIIGDRIPFETRDHRGATDPVNSALNYGYGILYTQVWGATVNAGLEPFAGFLHVDRPGKPSLVLDLIEEFRQPIVDRAVIATVTKGTAIDVTGGMLTDESRRTIARAVVERLESEITFRGRRHKVKSVIQIQARNLATFLRGGAAYRPFAFKW
jgi:CRISP-associated protein Cas1